MSEQFDPKQFKQVLDEIQAFRDSLTKKAFVPMTPDMPMGGGQAGNDGPQSGMPPGGAMMPPQGGPAQGQPQMDPSQMQGGQPPMDPSQMQGGAPQDPGGDPNGQVFESIIQGMQQLAETVQQMGQEFDQRIAASEQANQQLQQMMQQQDQTMQQIVPFIQQLQQPAPMDGSVQGGGPSGPQMMPPGGPTAGQY